VSTSASSSTAAARTTARSSRRPYRASSRAGQGFPIVLATPSPATHLARTGDARLRRARLRPGDRHRLRPDPIVEAVAKDFPEDRLRHHRRVSQLPNVASLVFKEQEGSYLVGMIAARTRRAASWASSAAMDVPLIHRFGRRLRGGGAGGQPADPGDRQLCRVTEAAWNNPGKGKEISLAQIAKGADVIFAAAGQLRARRLRRRRAGAEKWSFGVDSNQNWVKPGYVLTSMSSGSTTPSIRSSPTGWRAASRGIHVYGLENDGIGYAMDQYNAKAGSAGGDRRGRGRQAEDHPRPDQSHRRHGRNKRSRQRRGRRPCSSYGRSPSASVRSWPTTG